MHAWLYYIEGACDLLIGRPQLTSFTEPEFNSLLLLHISQGYHTYSYIVLTIFLSFCMEFAESLQHTSKSIEHYAFLIWILCTHCGLFYYDEHFPYKESQCSTLLLAKILQTPVKCYTKKTVDLFFSKIYIYIIHTTIVLTIFLIRTSES